MVLTALCGIRMKAFFSLHARASDYLQRKSFTKKAISSENTQHISYVGDWIWTLTNCWKNAQFCVPNCISALSRPYFIHENNSCGMIEVYKVARIAWNNIITTQVLSGFSGWCPSVLPVVAPWVLHLSLFTFCFSFIYWVFSTPIFLHSLWQKNK